MELEKFTKIMRLCESDQDGEALAALRKANAMLKSAGLNWAEFLARPPGNTQRENPIRDRPRNTHYYHSPAPESDALKRARERNARDHQKRDEVAHMLRACLAGVKGSGLSFIRSLDEAFRSYGKLTDNQERALRKFYRNLK